MRRCSSAALCLTAFYSGTAVVGVIFEGRGATVEGSAAGVCISTAATGVGVNNSATLRNSARVCAARGCSVDAVSLSTAVEVTACAVCVSATRLKASIWTVAGLLFSSVGCCRASRPAVCRGCCYGVSTRLRPSSARRAAGTPVSPGSDAIDWGRGTIAAGDIALPRTHAIGREQVWARRCGSPVFGDPRGALWSIRRGGVGAARTSGGACSSLAHRVGWGQRNPNATRCCAGTACSVLCMPRYLVRARVDFSRREESSAEAGTVAIPW